MRNMVWPSGMGVVLAVLAVSPSYGGQNITLNLSNQSNVNMATLRGFDPSTITGPSDPFPDTSNPFAASAFGGCASSQFGCGVPEGGSRSNLLQNCDPGVSPVVLPSTNLSTPVVDPGHPPAGHSVFPVQPPASEPLAQINITSCAPLTLTQVNHLGEAFQSLQNGLLSRLSTETSACAAVGPSSESNRCTQIEYAFSQNVSEKGQVFDMSFSVRSLTDASGNPIGSQGSYTQTLKEDGVTSTCGGTFTFDGNTADANGDGRPDGLTLKGPAHQC
ncbi:MAG: hypothetical protein HY207_06850 [Nitrospirae bacterium]|nr:hypothetical protein [Nitrospirota bacterium]